MFENKVVIITGGTRGIGRATAELFAERGAEVVIFGSRQETVDKALADFAQKNLSVSGFCPNLLKLSEIEKAVADIYEKFGHIDILINNAGIAAEKSIEDTSEEEFEKIINLNVNAAWRMCKAVVPYMKKSNFEDAKGAGSASSGSQSSARGVILNASSMVSFYGQATGVGYPASKFAINGLTKSLARELAPFGIRVNAVAPGVINTDMVANLPEAAIQPLIDSIPLGRIGEPRDIAEAFAWLASDEAAYISGAILPVDGLARS